MSTFDTGSASRRPQTRTIVLALLGIIAVVGIVLVFVFQPWNSNNGVATPEPTQSSTPTPGVTTYTDSDDSDSEDGDEKVDESAAFAKWTYPARYVKIATEAGFGKDTINDQDIPNMMMGTIPDDNNTIDLTIWPDSAGPALTSKSAAGVVLQTIVYADACAAYAVGMQSTPLFSDYHAVLKAYFPSDPMKVNDWAAKAVSGTDEEKLEGAKACSVVAKAWEDRLGLGVVNNITTSFNIHTVDGKINPEAPFTTAPEFEINPEQYTGEFVAFADVEKGQPWTCEDLILVNPGDGRFALPDCTVVVVTYDCTGTCGGWVCPYPLNPDGQCIPPKTVDYTQTHADGIILSQDDGVDVNQSVVITVIEDDDTTDEVPGSDVEIKDE